MRSPLPTLALRAFVVAAPLFSTPALAHIALDSPTPRYADLKQGPCGKGTLDARTANVTTVEAGATIAVTWHETINHPGHYRIAFDPNGQALFQNPTSFTDVDGGPGVLLDGIPDKADALDGGYGLLVTLPDVPCTNCTLQLIQVMTDKPPYGDGNDIYYQCADLVLLPHDAGTAGDAGTVDGGGVLGADAGASPDGGVDPAGGCGCATGTSTGALPVLLAGVVALAARARRRVTR